MTSVTDVPATPADPPADSPTREAAPRQPEVLRLEDIADKEHLAGAGNWLWKIPFRGGFAVLKGYYGNRFPLLHWKKTVGNTLITGKTSHMPRSRCRIENACVDAWEKHGFRCFGRYPEVTFSDLPEGLYTLFEYVPGVHFRTYFIDKSIPLEERLATWVRFIPEWHRRHKAAVEHGENLLLHENGDVKHVMLWEGDFVYFDFEVVFKSKDIRDLVGRELLAYLRSTGKFFGPELYDKMMDLTVEHYPDKSLLMEAYEHAFHNRSLIRRWGRTLDYRLRAQARKTYSKYNVALDLKRRLDAASMA
jgi:hypothetical protein